MNEKALRTLEYHKIIDLLVRHANCEAAKQRCKKLTPMTSLADIETAQRQTADALSRIFKKGSLSFLGVHDVTASMKRKRSEDVSFLLMRSVMMPAAD